MIALSLCLCSPSFRAFKTNKPNWRQVGVWNDKGRSLKIHLCGLEIYLCVGKYTSAVWICTKTTFSYFPVSTTPEKVNTLNDLWAHQLRFSNHPKYLSLFSFQNRQWPKKNKDDMGWLPPETVLEILLIGNRGLEPGLLAPRKLTKPAAQAGKAHCRFQD